MSEGVSRLKELLLDKEQREIGVLNARIDRVFERAGTTERMRQSVAEVLAESIRDVESQKERRTELAAAVSPVIIDTVRREVRASADELADKLHPHMGRMISAYVASAIKDMMAKMNRSLESGLSPRRWMIKVRSLVTGRSQAELLLADMNALRLQELYLIRRGSGDLIGHWEAVGAGEVGGAPVEVAPGDGGAAGVRSNRDAVVSAFLTAINDFAREAFAASDGGLQSLDVQSHKIYLRSSPGYLLAAKCSGVPTTQTERILDQEFASTIEMHRNLLAANGKGHSSAVLETLLPNLAASLQKSLDASAELGAGSRTNFAKWFLILLALGLMGWLAWEKWQTWQTERTRSAVETALSGSIMRSYVPGIEVERGGHVVRLRGLAPTEAEKTAALEAVRGSVAWARIDDGIEILPQHGDGGLQSFKRDVQESSASASLAAAQRAIQRARTRGQSIAAEMTRIARDEADVSGGPALEAIVGEVGAIAGELDEIAQAVMRAAAKDGLAPLQVRLGDLLTRLRQATVAIAEARGDKSVVAIARPTAATGRHDSVREEAELVATATDALWTEVVTLERHLLRRAILEIARRPVPKPIAVTRTPRQDLEEWISQNAIFFSVEATFRDPAESSRQLDAFAALLKRTDSLIRVVGYTDDLGTPQRNNSISLDRAVKVRQELVDRGVPAPRLAAVGRPSGPNLSQSTGLNSPNRRVEFEVGFEREANGGNP